MKPTKPRDKTVLSMTGYASGRIDLEQATIAIDVRTVNSRFADFHFKLSDELRDLEPMVREAISQRIARGKVECRMQWRASTVRRGASNLDPSGLETILSMERQIRAASPDAAPLSVADILRLTQDDFAAPAGRPDAGAEADGTSLWALCEPEIGRVLDDCVAARQREGVRLAAVISQQIDAMAKCVDELRPMLPAMLEQSRERLGARLAEAMPDSFNGIDAQETFARIRQEVALVSLRGDVAEELERLDIHLLEVRRILKTGGAAGKRLDFLSQELNREANTLASKATGLPITEAAVSLKLLIEQMREQVQNIE